MKEITHYEITCPTLGTRTLGVFDHLALVKDQLQLLLVYKNDGRVPSQELLDDIRAYESIVNAENPEERAAAYREERNREPSQRPRHVAMRLGWITAKEKTV